MPSASPAARALVAYSQGVNDYLARLRASGQWPAMFSLAGVYPADWTPVDSLVIQGVLTQELDFTATPLDYELLYRSLGARRTMAWFPVLPPNQQAPYDPGPYRRLPMAPVISNGALAAARTGPAGLTGASARTAASGTSARPGHRGQGDPGPGQRAARGAGASVPGQQRLGG